MPLFPGTKAEQLPTWGQVRAFFSLTRLRMLLLSVYTIDELRNTRYLLGKAVLILDNGKFGLFYRDDADTTTADNGQTVLLTSDDVPVRFKRHFPFTSSTTGARPSTTGLPTGYPHFDTTLGKPIWWNGTVWKDASGTTV